MYFSARTEGIRTFRHALRAAYRTAISAVQILVYAVFVDFDTSQVLGQIFRLIPIVIFHVLVTLQLVVFYFILLLFLFSQLFSINFCPWPVQWAPNLSGNLSIIMMLMIVTNGNPVRKLGSIINEIAQD